MNEHTPTPWETSGMTVVHFGEDGAVICNMAEPFPKDGTTTFEPIRLDSKGWKLQEANAKFICLACNNFKPMKKALQAIKNLCDGYTELDKETCSLYIGKVLSQIEDGE